MRGFGLAFGIGILLSINAAGQELDLIGQSGWEQWSARRLRVFADEIANYRSSTSDPLRLEIVATPELPSGGDFSQGYTIGTLLLRELRGNDSFFDIDYLVRYYAPTAGIYYTSIVLSEETDSGHQVTDWEIFTDPVNFGGYGVGDAIADEPDEPVFFEGNVSWRSAWGRVLLSADTIVNEGATRSGLLRMRLWATLTPYDGSLLDGYLLANKQLGKLKSGFQFINYERTAPFYHPPEGLYYITLTLEEKSGRGWFIRDWVNFPGQSLF
jgi:hypothetical protein